MITTYNNEERSTHLLHLTLPHQSKQSSTFADEVQLCVNVDQLIIETSQLSGKLRCGFGSQFHSVR